MLVCRYVRMSASERAFVCVRDRQTENLLRSISHLQLQCHSIAIQRRPVLRPEISLPHRPPTIIIIIIDSFINL